MKDNPSECESCSASLFIERMLLEFVITKNPCNIQKYLKANVEQDHSSTFRTNNSLLEKLDS